MLLFTAEHAIFLLERAGRGTEAEDGHWNVRGHVLSASGRTPPRNKSWRESGARQ